MVTIQTILTLLLSSMVAYGFSKYNFRGKNLMFMCVLLVMMVPLEILMLPMYTQVNAMGMRNSYVGVMHLMITGSCFAILPLLLIYLFAQKFIVEGMTAGAVKG